MAAIVAIIGGIVLLLGMVGVVSPATMKSIGNYFRTPGSLYVAVSIRVVIGALLIVAGPHCRPDTPWVGLTVRIIGGLVVVAAVTLLFLGSGRFLAMLDWGLSRPPMALRLWAVVAVAMGGFFLYAGT